MSELAPDFQSLPPDYQRVLQLAQERHQLRITPLQTLVGGWSGAMVYLVSVAHRAAPRVEHLILKLDRKIQKNRPDELERHTAAQGTSPAAFARDHFATLAFERTEADGAVAIFYSIAGQSLQAFRPVSSYSQQHQLEVIFRVTHRYLLEEWNSAPAFATLHPQEILKQWLGFRLNPGAPIESFLRQACQADPERPGLLIRSSAYPNPLRYARRVEDWGNARPIDAALGLQHGDLNTNNILVRFSPDGRELNGYYLIDFALFKEDMPLLYDLRYMEMAYLTVAMSQVSPAKIVDMILQMAHEDGLDPRRASIEMSGVSAVIVSSRAAFGRWVTERHPSLHDDLWGQYWLAGAAAGLSFCHKAGQADEPRLAGLIFAAANLRRYFEAFSIPLPADVQPIYGGVEADASLRAGSTPPGGGPRHNLPTEPTPFIGRAREVAALRGLILHPAVRLVTLLGPGGTGKTRLSLQVARDALAEFPHGVFFVPLADDLEANQLISRMAQQLGVREGGRPLLENIKDYLREKRLLLVLDNFEQLLPAAPLVADLLATAPQLKIMTSSRIALKLSGEYEFPVPPFELPRIAGEPTLEELTENESVLLFVERARSVQPAFTLTKENAAAVAEICRRLDGLPLALELAAARIKLLPPQAILSRLDDRLRLLTGGARDLPSRHRALRNTLEWSYSLLKEEEKILYARLSVFVGGFTFEAAEAVCNADGRLDILEGLTSLVDNSLLRQEELSGGEPRFGMLETIRAYALERLAESGEMDVLRARHARFFGDRVVTQLVDQLYSADSLSALIWLERELDNLRATLSWCLSTPQGIELAAGVVFSLIWFWYRRGYFMEGHMWAERVLSSPALPAMSVSRAIALQSSGILAIWKGEHDTALARLQESLSLHQRFEDDQWMAYALMSNAVALINMGRDRAAQPLLEQAREMFREQQQKMFHAVTLVHLGNVELGLENSEQARRLHAEALGEARLTGEPWLISFALNNLGEVARVQGQYELARRYYEECVVLLRNTGDKGDMARFVHTLGYIAQHEGDFARAEAQFRMSLAMFRQLGNRRGMAECMAGLAGLKARQGQAEWGMVMLSAAESVLKATGGAWWPADRVEVEANQEVIRAALSEETWAAAQAKGRAMSLEQALAFATGP